jgi:hypothetical protein
VGNTSFTLTLVVALFAGMLLALECGHRLGRRSERLDPNGAHSGTGPVEGAVFALLGLLVAFTFSGAATRFDGRRQLIVDEANDIGTAYLRTDLVPAEARAPLRDLFRTYVDTRLAAYRQPTIEGARAKLAEVEALQGRMWSQAMAGCQAAGPQPCAILLLPALNAMFDIVTTRTAAIMMHPPVVLFGMLYGVAIACAFLAGYSLEPGRRRKWSHSITFALVTALTVWVILDLEYPRLGFIRVDAFDQVLMDVRASMDR